MELKGGKEIINGTQSSRMVDRDKAFLVWIRYRRLIVID